MNPPQQGAFLGMALFIGKDIAPQAVCGFIDQHGFPRPGAALHLAPGFEAPFTRCNIGAINHVHAIPRHPGGRSPSSCAINGGNTAALECTSSAAVGVSTPLSVLETEMREAPTSSSRSR